MWIEAIGKSVILLFILVFALKIVNRFYRILTVIGLIVGILYLINSAIVASIYSTIQDAGTMGDVMVDQVKGKFPDQMDWLDKIKYYFEINF